MNAKDEAEIVHTDGFGFDYVRCGECDMLVRVGEDNCGICGSEVA